MSIPVTQSPLCNTTFRGYSPCQNRSYGYTSWSPGTYSKAELQAQKRYLKIQARASKNEAHALTREAKSQVKELKHEIKHQTKELKREVKRQAKEFKRETRHHTQGTLKTIENNPQGGHCYKHPVSPADLSVPCTNLRHGRYGDCRQRKQERQLERHARRDCRRHHQSMPLQFILRTVIKRTIHLLTGQELRTDSHPGQHITVIRPEPLVATSTVPTRSVPRIYTTSPCIAPTLVHCTGTGVTEISRIPHEPLLVYAMSNMTLKPHPADGIPSQVPSLTLSQLETPIMTAPPRPELELVVQEDHNVDLDIPPPPYQASMAHQWN